MTDTDRGRGKKVVKRTERGWPGHFIASSMCVFRRNTLLECGRRRIVVSTVGNMRTDGGSKSDTIGLNRNYETMAFHAHKDGIYWEADVSRQVNFESEWAIEELEQETDQKANDMHEAVVAELTNLLLKGNTP